MPCDREGTCKTELFERYQRNEKALVLALMEMVHADLMRSAQGVSTRKVKKITDELCGRRFSRQTVSRLAQQLDEQVWAWAERGLEKRYPFLIVDAMQVDDPNNIPRYCFDESSDCAQGLHEPD